MSTTNDNSIPVRFKSESAVGTGPAVLEVGGFDMARHAKGVTIRSAVGEIASVTIDAIALGGLDVTLPANVVVNIQPLEAGVMDVTTLADGTVRYRFVRVHD